MFLKNYYESSNLAIYHLIWVLMFHGCMCPNFGLLALIRTYRVLQGWKCSKCFSYAMNANLCCEKW